MAWYDGFGKKSKKSPTGYAEQDNSGAWISYFNQVLGSLNSGKLITYRDSTPYELACNVAEMFIPVDAIADRAASVDYDLVYEKTGELYEAKGNLKRLIDKPNPFDQLADIVYKDVFSKFSDGNGYVYTKTPESLKNPTIDNISNIWVLKPNVTKPVFLKYIANPFLLKDKKDLIEYYKTFFMIKHQIEPRYVVHSTVLGLDENGCGISPFTRVERNINNILAVYHARYNVYAKNGNGGILSKAPSVSGSSLQEAVDPITRDAMLADLQSRNGIVGDKNFIGISSIPLQFIKTLGTIQELQPFEETESNAVTIAGIFGVDAELIPRKGSSTFTNKNDAEKALWQNVVKSVCEDEAKILTQAYYLPEGVVFRPNFSKVEALQEDKKTAYEADGLLIDNLDKLKASGQTVDTAYKNITDKYNGK